MGDEDHRTEGAEPALRWAEFVSTEEERAFRAHHVAAAGRLTALAILATSILIVLNVRGDFLLAASEAQLALQLAIRALNAALGLAVAIYALRTKAASTLESATFFWLMLTVVSKFAVLAMRPSGYHAHIASDIVFLLVALLILPISFRAQLTSMAAFALADATIALAFRDPMPRAATLSTSFTYAVAISLGGLASYRTQVVLRREFALLRRESAFRASLAKALAEVRTLRGIVPICASCHSIRDDAGFWHAVEVYVRAHTHADFSHGICPSCVRTLYPELADDILRASADEPGAASLR